MAVGTFNHRAEHAFLTVHVSVDAKDGSAWGEESFLSSTLSCAEQPVSSRFQHQALFYDGLGALAATLVPFIREGIVRGEPVLVALLSERLGVVEAALGPDASRVDFVDMGELGANPARIIPEWRRFLEDQGKAGPVRGVGEPVWSGRREVEIEEAGLHESLLNLAFDDGPGWQLMCPYDMSSLPAHVIDDAVRNHPITSPLHGGAVRYAGREHARTRFAAPLSPAPRDADCMSFGGDDLAGLRSIVTRLAGQAGINPAATEDLVLAAHELATNSVIHADGGGVLRAWTQSDAFVVEICDAGMIEDPLVGRDLLQELAENGRGVWMANQLCDLVQVRSGPAGTVVRLFSWL